MIKEFIVSANKLTSKMLQEIFKEVKNIAKRARYHINWINILDEAESGVVNPN